MSYTHIYTNMVDAEMFVKWLRQYIVDMTSPAVLEMFGKHAGLFVQLPTHNRPIPIGELQISEIPIDRQFRMDILNRQMGTPNYRYSFSVYFQPQSDLAQVQVWGWNTSFPTLVNEYIKLKERLEWNFPIKDDSVAPLSLAIDPNRPPLPSERGWDLVFHWYYSVPRWVCLNLGDLSEKIGYAYPTVRNKHSEYVAQYGEHPIENNKK